MITWFQPNRTSSKFYIYNFSEVQVIIILSCEKKWKFLEHKWLKMQDTLLKCYQGDFKAEKLV